jgi:hypothetical protein
MEAILTSAGMSAATAATVSTVIQVVSTAASVMGAMSQANSNSENYSSQAGTNDYNAAVARNSATAALNESTAAQAAQRRRARELLGEQRAGIAQSGTGFGGSNADIMERSTTLSELDALNLAYEGDMKAKNYLAQAGMEDYNAALNRRNARTAKTAGYLGAGRSLLVGVGSYGRGVGADATYRQSLQTAASQFAWD